MRPRVTIPAIETLEKMARALEIPLYQLFYDGDEPPKPLSLPDATKRENQLFGMGRKDSRYLRKLATALAKVEEPNGNLLLFMATKIARPRRVNSRER